MSVKRTQMKKRKYIKKEVRDQEKEKQDQLDKVKNRPIQPKEKELIEKYGFTNLRNIEDTIQLKRKEYFKKGLPTNELLQDLVVLKQVILFHLKKGINI